MILSKSMTGAMWKSKTKYWKFQSVLEYKGGFQLRSHLVIVGAVGGLLDRWPFLSVANLYIITMENILTRKHKQYGNTEKLHSESCLEKCGKWPPFDPSKCGKFHAFYGLLYCLLYLYLPGHRPRGPCWARPAAWPLSQWCRSGSPEPWGCCARSSQT